MSNVRNRLDRLAARLQPTDKVIGYYYDVEEADWHDHVPGVVTLCRPPHEQMTVEEFQRRYPYGTLIRVTYDEDWRNERQSTT
jgi:hypothetical protein